MTNTNTNTTYVNRLVAQDITKNANYKAYISNHCTAIGIVAKIQQTIINAAKNRKTNTEYPIKLRKTSKAVIDMVIAELRDRELTINYTKVNRRNAVIKVSWTLED